MPRSQVTRGVRGRALSSPGKCLSSPPASVPQPGVLCRTPGRPPESRLRSQLALIAGPGVTWLWFAAGTCAEEAPLGLIGLVVGEEIAPGLDGLCLGMSDPIAPVVLGPPVGEPGPDGVAAPGEEAAGEPEEDPPEELEPPPEDPDDPTCARPAVGRETAHNAISRNRRGRY